MTTDRRTLLKGIAAAAASMTVVSPPALARSRKAAPRLVKCELCKDRLAEGKQPACTEVCPRKAVIFGPYDALLDEAHARLKASPNHYVQKVYGEKELGGTQVLYLSHVPFEDLGFRFNTDQPVPEIQQTVQHGIYKGFVGP